MHSYLHLSSVVSDDEPKEDDGRQADKTFQCQGIHGALQKHITQTQLNPYTLKNINTQRKRERK